MSKILIDRAVVERALEALELVTDLTNHDDEIYDAIDTFCAALAEPVLNPAPGYCKHCKQYTIEEPLPAEPVQEPPQDHFRDVTKKVQEPVAWIEHEWAGTGLRKLHFEKRDPTVRDEVVNPVWTPLYAAPPQRLPLTDDQLDDIAVAARRGNLYDLRIAIERAHGIKE